MMATLNFSRFSDTDLKIKEDRLFNPIFDFTRSDGTAINFTGKTIKFEIYDRHGGTLQDTLTSGTEITIATAKLTFDKTFTDLTNRGYYYRLFNDTDKISIMTGKLIVL